MPDNDAEDVKSMPVSERNSPGTKYAGPGTSYPIRPGHPEDVKNAWDLAGHAANPDEIRANVRRIARKLGMASALPGTAKDDAPAKAILSDDTLGFYGGEVKALGDGRIAGPLVRFNKPDVQGDMFALDTYFGPLTSVPIYYHHGIPRRGDAYSAEIGNADIGVAEVKARDDMLWMEGTLDLSRPVVAQLYADIQAGKMGLSSGSAERFVRREPVKSGLAKILRWPLCDASVTPIPVEPTNRVYAIKALMSEPDAGLGYDDCYRDSNAAEAALRALADGCISAVCSLMCADEDSVPAAERTARIRAEFADFGADGLAVVMALLDDDGPAAKAIVDRVAAKAGDAPTIDAGAITAPTDTPARAETVAVPTLADRSERLVADVSEIAGLFRKAHDQRAADGRSLSPAKRDAVKAVADALLDLHRASAPTPDADRLLAIRRRLLAGRL